MIQCDLKEELIRVSLEDVITMKFRYDHLLGRCRDCAMINRGGLPCQRLQEFPSLVAPPVVSQPNVPHLMVFRGNTSISLSVPHAVVPPIPKDKRTMPIREVHVFPSPTKIIGVREWRMTMRLTTRVRDTIGPWCLFP
ncbi:hypothetical protein ACLB2K_059938 [Fragaria x ananassa]